jgi:hypothetical protein
MSKAGKEISRYATAELSLCNQAGPMLIDLVREIEKKSGIKVREIRVTIDAPDAPNGWAGANCVIVREACDSAA